MGSCRSMASRSAWSCCSSVYAFAVVSSRCVLGRAVRVRPAAHWQSGASESSLPRLQCSESDLVVVSRTVIYSEMKKYM